MSPISLWYFRAALVSVVDGDTVRLLLDQGCGGRQQEDIRLLDVWAPETEDPGGPETTAFVQGWFSVSGLRWPLVVKTMPNTKPEPGEKRSFVRYIGQVWQLDHYEGELAVPGRYLNQDIIDFVNAHPDWAGAASS